MLVALRPSEDGQGGCTCWPLELGHSMRLGQVLHGALLWESNLPTRIYRPFHPGHFQILWWPGWALHQEDTGSRYTWGCAEMTLVPGGTRKWGGVSQTISIWAALNSGRGHHLNSV